MFKPMLAATLEDLSQLTFPVIVSPKLDGLRCIIREGVAVSRNLKPFRNRYVQEMLSGRPEIEGYDGELIVGSPTEGNVLGRTQSGIMSEEGTPEFLFHVFDKCDTNLDFISRFELLQNHNLTTRVPHYTVRTPEEFLVYEQAFLVNGYEGIMARRGYTSYKHGRSTLREGALIKYKRFMDSEGLVESIEEGIHNLNEAETDLLGRTKRSNHTENKVPSGKVGTLFVRDLKTNELISVSPGRMTHDMRQFYWERPDKLIGEIVKYKWFDYGRLDAPRFATFQAIRSAEDL